MNQEKAREFFSTYYEESLDSGLSQAVERALDRDPELREDFRQFQRTYEELSNLKFETIEIPFDLNDRIGARIDRHLLEQKHAQRPSWTTWLRTTAIATVAVIAVLGAILSLQHNSGPVATAGLTPFGQSSTKDQIDIAPLKNGSVDVHYSPSAAKTLIIREGLGGQERRRISLDHEDLSTQLQNTKPGATAFSIEVNGDRRSTLIALPGSDRSMAKAGEGNLEAFAKALASHYGVPVEVRVEAPNVSVSWKFDAADPEEAAAATLDVQRYSIERRGSGLLVISDPDAFK